MMQPGTVQFTPACFENFKSIGVGKDSTIYAAQCSKLGGVTVAIKVYLKSRTTASKLRAIKREAQLMQYMLKKCVASVTKFYGAFQDDERICIVMEYCPRGDLLELLLAENRAFSEERVAQVAISLLQTFQHMHSLHLIHRDVKLENIFIGAGGELKLGDFGLTMSTLQESAISPVGTTEYMAPEVVRLPKVELVTSGQVDMATLTPCTSAVDIWALGITLYELLSGHLPYEKHDKATMRRAILKGELRPLPPSASPAACDFLGLMLQPDVSKRGSPGQLLQHPFLAARGPDFSDSPRSVLPPVAYAAAHIAQPQPTPWTPTKGRTSCTEVLPQPRVSGAPKLSIPETPEQLRGSPSPTRANLPKHLGSPVVFWNPHASPPDAAPDGPLIRASYGAAGLATPGFPASTPAAWQSQPQPQHGFSLLRPVCKAQATAKAAPAEAQLGAASPPPHSPPPPSDGSRTPPQQGESRSPYLLQAAAAASPSAPSPRAAVRPQAWLPSWDADRPSSPMRQRLELQAASQMPSARSPSPGPSAPGGAQRVTSPAGSPLAAQRAPSNAAALDGAERNRGRPGRRPGRPAPASPAEAEERAEDRMPAAALKACGSSGLLSPYSPAALGDAAAAEAEAAQIEDDSNPFAAAPAGRSDGKRSSGASATVAASGGANFLQNALCSDAGGGLSIATSGWPGQHSDGSEAHSGGGADSLSWRTGSCAQPAAQPWSPVRLLQRLSSLLGSSALVAAG